MSDLQINKKNGFTKDAFLTTTFTFFISWILSFLIINFHALDPIGSALHDIKFIDYFVKNKGSNSASHEKHKEDSNILIVDIENSNRSQVVSIIQKVIDADPKVLGLDITFDTIQNLDEDKKLVELISKNSDLFVLATKFDFQNDTCIIQKTILDTIKNVARGHIHFSEETRTIRYFKPIIQHKDGLMKSFSLLVSEKYNPAICNLDKSILKEKIKINYRYGVGINRFTTIDSIGLDSMSLILKNKIVLIGFNPTDTNNLSLNDLHFTPLNSEIAGKSNPDMYGIEILATIVAMYIEDDFIFEIPWWATVLVAFGITFLLIKYFLKIFCDEKKHVWFHISYIGARLAVAIILFVISFILFVFGAQFEIVSIMLPLSLSIDSIYLMEYIVRKTEIIFPNNIMFRGSKFKH